MYVKKQKQQFMNLLDVYFSNRTTDHGMFSILLTKDLVASSVIDRLKV
jgi:hypothetical protein